MDDIVSCITVFCYFITSLLSLSLFLRAILSWFIGDGESRIMIFLVLITEPVVGIVRKTVGRFFESMAIPIDISYLITIILVEILNIILGGAVSDILPSGIFSFI